MPKTESMTHDHDKFLSLLGESDQGVWLAARWLRSRGYRVSVPPMSMAPTFEERFEHSDEGDLFIESRVEVKQLTVSFTCAGDWPFGSKFIVCSKHSFDRASPKPVWYLIINKEGSHAAIVNTRRSGLWHVEKRADSRFNGREQEFYFAPLDSIDFVCMSAPT